VSPFRGDSTAFLLKVTKFSAIVTAVWLLDEVSGERRSAQRGERQTGGRGGGGIGFNGQDATGFTTTVYFDTDGASRFYPQFKNEAELVTWVERLVGVA